MSKRPSKNYFFKFISKEKQEKEFRSYYDWKARRKEGVLFFFGIITLPFFSYPGRHAIIISSLSRAHS